jgi:hypothetical protein
MFTTLSPVLASFMISLLFFSFAACLPAQNKQKSQTVSQSIVQHTARVECFKIM